jgi:hypothetical protein
MATASHAALDFCRVDTFHRVDTAQRSFPSRAIAVGTEECNMEVIADSRGVIPLMQTNNEADKQLAMDGIWLARIGAHASTSIRTACGRSPERTCRRRGM